MDNLFALVARFHLHIQARRQERLSDLLSLPRPRSLPHSQTSVTSVPAPSAADAPSTISSTSMNRPIITAEFLLPPGSRLVPIRLDSGPVGSIMDEDFALQLGLQLEPLLSPFPARALDGHFTVQVNDKTSPVCMLLLGGHGEYIQFLVLPKSNQPAQPRYRLDHLLYQRVEPNLPADLPQLTVFIGTPGPCSCSRPHHGSSH